jgi:hypothetical protein
MVAPGRPLGEASQQGDQMSRNFILALGAFMWTLVAVDAISHLATGDFLVPAVMAVLAFTWTGLRWGRRPARQAVRVNS